MFTQAVFEQGNPPVLCASVHADAEVPTDGGPGGSGGPGRPDGPGRPGGPSLRFTGDLPDRSLM